MVRTTKESVEHLDTLVEAGIAGSRSEAAAFLIGEGVKARQELFDKIADKVDQIRKTKEELRGLLDQDADGDRSEAG
jgi:Arc/MetJ-type ribon-helix-helix transcriptional regulator